MSYALFSQEQSSDSAMSYADSPKRSTTEMDLTPRSKVRALMAAWSDDDSDKDNEPSKTSYASFRERLKARTQMPTIRADQDAITPTSSSENEDPVAVPRGKTAARMQAQHNRDPENQAAAAEDSDASPVPHHPFGSSRKRKRIYDRLATPPLQRVGARSSTPPHAAESICSLQSVSDVRLIPSTIQEGSAPDLNSDTDSEVPNLPPPKTKLQELVERRRMERMQKEQAASHSLSTDDEMPHPPVTKSKKAKKAPPQQTTIVYDSDDDHEAGIKLTEQARPTRKASKKAMEQMKQETERLRRNMQLTLAPTQKKKFSVQDFMAKFQPKRADETPISLDLVEPTNSSSTCANTASTPPSSPPSTGLHSRDASPATPKPITNVAQPLSTSQNGDEDDLPNLCEVLTQPAEVEEPVTLSLGNSIFTRKTASSAPAKPSMRKFAKSKVVRRSATDDDDDLEILKSEPAARLRVFDNVAASKGPDSRPIHILRTLAHLNAPRTNRKGQPSISYNDLKSSLQARAKEQAMMERNARLQNLKDKGIIVQTVEEKERDQMELENMLERARQEAQALAEQERADAKQDGKEVDELPSEDEDDDWQGSDEDVDVELDGGLVLSGSEEEVEEEEEGEDPDNEEVDGSVPDISVEVGEVAGTSTEGNVHADEESDVDNVDLPDVSHAMVMKRRRKQIVDSDDDDQDSVATPSAKPSIDMESPLPNVFGFSKLSPLRVGLSQVFAGTLAASQTQENTPWNVDDSQQNSIPFIHGLPNSTIADPLAIGGSLETPMRQRFHSGSITQVSGPGLLRFDTQSQVPHIESQASEIPDPTQDDGFPLVPITAPPQKSGVPHSTVDAILLTPMAAATESQSVGRRSRLLRRSEIVEGDEVNQNVQGIVGEVEQHDAQQTLPVLHDAFDLMRQARDQVAQLDNFDKKTSRAKGMVEEQAEESDDEYAGLGGASDDESQGEMDEETRDLIDDDTEEKLNERQVAALFADKEREDDEKRVAKLYKDIHNGAFRRKRGAGLDFDESDDEDEAAARRRAAKQREFAKMRKALLADEKLEKIASNPKQQAFLQAIEDHDLDDDIAFLNGPEETFQSQLESQSQSQSQSLPRPLLLDSQGQTPYHTPTSTSAAAPPATAELMAFTKPSNPRRTAHSAYTKPTTLAAIRTTLSELIGEPDSLSQPAEEILSDGDSDHDEDVSPVDDPSPLVDKSEAGVSDSPRVRRVPVTAARAAVIDRMALRRAASSSTNTHVATTSGGRLAFAAPASGLGSSFRMPSLLRRATTNQSTDSQGSSGGGYGSANIDGNVGARVGASGSGKGREAVKMGGSKKSSVNYHVREQERRKKVEEAERVRQERRVRLGEMRRKGIGMGLGILAGGSFG